MAIKIPEINQALVVPASTFDYPTLGTAYRCGEYTITHSSRIARTGRNYYDSRRALPEGIRMSTATEELAIQLALERAGEDTRQAEVFSDLFGRGGWYAWQWTDTGLRVPKGRDPSKYETDAQGRKYWHRIALIGDQEVAELQIPEGKGNLVVEWNKLFGIPAETRAIEWPHTPYTTHSWFNPKPKKDEISGHYDVAVVRRSSWHHDPGRCLFVDACYGRWDAGSGDCVRPVRGLVPEILKE